MTPYRILVTGWRHWPGEYAHVIHEALVRTAALADPGRRPIIVVQGECEYGGVDLWANEWAVHTTDAEPEPHPAKRDSQGRILGPARNARMVALGADVCLAFPGPGSRGTMDCIRKAKAAGIPTMIRHWHDVLKL